MTEHDPLMVALIQKLPAPGADWPIDQRALWLLACEGVLNLIYGPVEKIDIDLPSFEEIRANGRQVLTEDKPPPIAAPVLPANAPAEPEERTDAAPADRETASEPEYFTGKASLGDGDSISDGIIHRHHALPPLKPVAASASGRRPGRPDGIPSNVAMAIEAIQELGPSGATAIRGWCRKKYWLEMPDAWSACLYDLVHAGKLRRAGINFVLPGPEPETAPPPAPPPEKPAPAPRQVVTPGAKLGPPARSGVKFEYEGRSVMMISSREYVLAGKLLAGMGKGHIPESFLAQSVLGMNTEVGRDTIRSNIAALNARLAEVGLVAEYHKGFGFMMKELP